jgi:hypothetical protein
MAVIGLVTPATPDELLGALAANADAGRSAIRQAHQRRPLTATPTRWLF